MNTVFYAVSMDKTKCGARILTLASSLPSASSVGAWWKILNANRESKAPISDIGELMNKYALITAPGDWTPNAVIAALEEQNDVAIRAEDERKAKDQQPETAADDFTRAAKLEKAFEAAVAPLLDIGLSILADFLKDTRNGHSKR